MEPKTKLLDQVRDAIRLRHLSLRTEEAYLGWIRRFRELKIITYPSQLVGGSPDRRYLQTTFPRATVA